MKKIIITVFSFVLFFTAQNAFASVSWNTASNDCRSIAVANYTTNTGIIDPCWPLSSVTASPSNSVNVRIYYHNTGNQPATNVRVLLNAPTINNATNTHSFTGQIISDQSSVSFGPVYINLTSAQKLSFGSTRWYANQTQNQTGFLYGQDGSELISNGLQLGTIESGWPTQGSVVASFYVTNPAPTGSLTAANSSCVISSGQSTCSINFSWNTNNPIGVSSVTRDGGSTVGTGNNSSSSFTIPYPGATFRLYNDSKELDVESVTTTCISNTSWNNSLNLCELIRPTGSLIASNPSCEISAGQSSCSIPFSWSVNNPSLAGISLVTRDGGSTVGTGNNSSSSFTIPYPGATFRLKHNSVELDVKSVTSSCVYGTTWNNNTCALPISDCEISNFAANPMESSPGSLVVLSWTTNNCNSVNISNVSSGNNLPSNGSKNIWPMNTTTYILTGIGGTSVTPTRTVTITVGGPVGAPGFPAGAPGFGF
jgi:hypothetical protein